MIILVVVVGAIAAQLVLDHRTADEPAVGGPSVANLSDQAGKFSTADTAPAVAPATQAAWGPGTAVLNAIPVGSAVERAGADTKLVALTFDDGPSTYTRAIVETLARNGATATFFVVGRQVQANPHDMQRIVDAGNEIGDHTWSHADVPKLKAKERRSEIQGTSDVIKQVVGLRPQLFRPPYGSMTAKTNALARTLGMLPVVWTVDTSDYKATTAREIVDRALAGLEPGAIILMHDGGGDRSKTVAALPLILKAIADRGYDVVTVSQLLHEAPPAAGNLREHL